MTIEPAVLIGFIGAILALLGLVFRMFVNGQLMNPEKAVPRADYDKQVAIVATYAEKFSEQTTAVKGLAGTVERLASRK